MSVNGVPVHGAVHLKEGDVVRVDDVLMVFTRHPADPPPSGDGLVGSSHVMEEVRRSIDTVAARRHAVVVTGETGTGKEVVALAIHRRSGRSGPFVAINCSTFTDELLASELFGHVRGAFTGAVSENTGLFRAARGGTLMLDELADIPMSVQAALLRVLETRTVRPVGGAKDIEVDVRVIATTHSELVELVHAGRFRADLYARLAQWTVRTPRLSERREDIPELTAHLLPLLEGAGRRLSTDLCEALLVHEWPLNVRGLSNILSIAVISSPDDGSPLALTPEVADALRRTRSMTVEYGTTPWGAEPRASAPEPTEPEWNPPRVFLRDELEALMVKFEGHVAAAARSLHTTRPTLYRMLSAHGLVPADFRRARTPSRPPAATPDECCPDPDPGSCTPTADPEVDSR
jgi:DNA-binding NtrC family response regulator